MMAGASAGNPYGWKLESQDGKLKVVKLLTGQLRAPSVSSSKQEEAALPRCIASLPIGGSSQI